VPKIFEPGTFLRIPLSDGTFGYGRTIVVPFVAYYDYRTETPDSDLDRIASKPILFRVAVRYQKPSSYQILGCKALEEHLMQPIVQFMQDVGDFRRCTIFDSPGSSRAAEPQECIGLERVAVWDDHHVKDRLLDTFMGRPNGAVEHLKVRLQ
jgi:hypothetical protein